MFNNNKNTIVILLILIVFISCKSTTEQPEQGVGGGFRQIKGRKNIYRLNENKFDGYFEINNQLPTSHYYRILTLVDMKQVDFIINDSKVHYFDTKIKPFSKRTYRFEVPGLTKRKHNLVTALLQDINKATTMKKSANLDNVIDKAIVIFDKEDFDFKEHKTNQIPRAKYDGIFFHKGDVAYYPYKLNFNPGEAINLDLMISSLSKEFDFVLVFFINGNQQFLSSGERYFSGSVKKGFKVFIRPSLKKISKRGNYRLDILMITSPFGKEDNLSRFTDSIKVSVK